MNNLNILYEDNHIIVVEKKPGILSQADNTKDIDMLSLIKKYLKEKYKKEGNVYLGLVHRLDRPVGGIMIFAKTSKAASRLSEQIRTGIFQKYYYAVVKGVLENKSDTLVDFYEKLDDKKIVFNTTKSKEAKLEYSVLKEKNNLSLVDIHLFTGRYHQIRIQFNNIGHPLYNDHLYDKESKNNIMLFAYKIKFIHPTLKEEMEFSLEIPKKFEELF